MVGIGEAIVVCDEMEKGGGCVGSDDGDFGCFVEG